MAQFDVHRFRGGYLLDCQSDIFDRFDTRFVVPLMPTAEVPRNFPRLMPIFDLDGRSFLMATQLASAIAAKDLGKAHMSLADHRYRIQAALDMLISGY